MELTIPGIGNITLKTLVLDLNGSLSVKGKIVPGVKKRLAILKQRGMRIVFLSADTRNNAANISKKLNIEFIKTTNAQEKLKTIKMLGPSTCVAIGNGLIDYDQINEARIGIVTLQAEGAHTKTLMAADIVVTSINDALDLIIEPINLISTLRL